MRKINFLLLIMAMCLGFKVFAQEGEGGATSPEEPVTIAEEDVRVIFGTSQVNCADNEVKVDKTQRDCEIILNYSPLNFNVYVLKLYKRGTTEMDMNKFGTDPNSFAAYNKAFNYSSDISLASDEKVTGVSAKFIPNESNERIYDIQIRVQISKYRDRTPADVPEEEEGEPVDHDNLDPHIILNKRQVEVKKTLAEIL